MNKYSLFFYLIMSISLMGCEPETTEDETQFLVEGEITDSSGSSNSLEQRVAQLEAQMNQANIKLGTFIVHQVNGVQTVEFRAVNVQISNGTGDTLQRNGAGNLILGYNEPSPQENKEEFYTGSHNLVIGKENSYESAASIISGRDNNATSAFAFVGGMQNRVQANGAAILSGMNNRIVGGAGNSAIIAGDGNTTRDDRSVIVAGQDNEILLEALNSVIVAGHENTVEGARAVAVGGKSNESQGSNSVAISGVDNKAIGDHSAVVSGRLNKVFAKSAAAVAGKDNRLRGINSAIVAGTLNETGRVNSEEHGYESAILAGQELSTKCEHGCGIGAGVNKELNDSNNFLGQ